MGLLKFIKSFVGRRSTLDGYLNRDMTYTYPRLERRVSTEIGDSGINLDETQEVILSRNDLYGVAYHKFKNANGNLAGEIYNFMNSFIFDGKNLEYRNIDQAIKYIESLSFCADEEAKRAAETSVTLIRHLNDYLSRQSQRGDSASSQGFKNYLFGERGVLTQKRLKDMRKASDVLSKNRNLEARKNYKVGKSSFDALNASYTKDERGKYFVNVNDDHSLGMETNHGKLYWGIFDKMFSDDNGKINTRAAVTKYVKKHLSNLNKEGKVEYIKGVDWKLNEVRNYSRFV